MRNNRTNTSVAAYSTRARAHAPVSVPLSWDELSAKVLSDHYDVDGVRRRLSRLRRDPWAGYSTCRQRIAADAVAALRELEL
jgi:bifunctional non-homologous end joining protein LigD